MTGARRDGLARREAILDAALECFVARGVLATGIEDVRRAAGASPSSIYHLFEGMPGIVAALLERTFARLFGQIARRVARAKTAEATVRALVAAHLDWVLANPDEARVMYQAMTLELAKDHAAALAARKAELLAPVVVHAARFIAAGELPRWSPLVLDVVLLGASHEACRRWLGGAEIDPRWMRRTLPGLAWASIEGRVRRAR